MKSADGRVVVWFSCGAASAVAAKLTVDKYPDAQVVYCDTSKTEHPDNMRFFGDVEKWIGKPIKVIKSTKYATIDDVFEKEQYMSGPRGARCTLEMKKLPRFGYQLPGDLHIFGLTADETRRISLFEKNNSDIELEWILLDAGISKTDCYQIIKDAGIALPALYSYGFKNNNCIGCVKSTSPAYWDRVRTFFPEVFERRVIQSRKIGCRLVELHDKRIFLDELPAAGFKQTLPEPDVDCGVMCETDYERVKYAANR